MKSKENQAIITKSIDIVELNNVTKTYPKHGKKVKAVNNISLKFKKQDHVGIIGANGAGKTTLVEMICGVRKPSAGNIKYNFTKNNSKPHINIGMQFQETKFPEGLIVKDILKFYMEVFESSLSKRELNNYLNLFQMTDKLRSKISSLSGGQQQRLNIVLSLLHKPELIILDEISTGLDVQSRNNIKRFVKDLAEKNNLTIFLISHNMDEILYLCDRIILMNEGTIYLDSPIKDIIEKYGSVDALVQNYFDNIETKNEGEFGFSEDKINSVIEKHFIKNPHLIKNISQKTAEIVLAGKEAKKSWRKVKK